MTVGLGYAFPGFALSVFVLVVLTTAAKLERHYVGGCVFSKVYLTCDHAGGKTLLKVEEILDEFDLAAMRISDHSVTADGQTDLITVEYCSRHKHHREVIMRFVETPEIREMRRDVTAAPKPSDLD